MLGNIREVSRVLGCNYIRLYRLHQRGLVPATRVGRSLLVDVDRTRAVLAALDATKKKEAHQ